MQESISYFLNTAVRRVRRDRHLDIEESLVELLLFIISN